MSANSAIKARIYPTAHQEAYLRTAMLECVRWYNIHLAWYKSEYESCMSKLSLWDKEHGYAWTDEDLTTYKSLSKSQKSSFVEKKNKERKSNKDREDFSASLSWPSKTKMGWAKSLIHPDEKYTSCFGSPKFVNKNKMNEAVEDALGVAIKAKNNPLKTRFISTRNKHSFCVPLVKKVLETRRNSEGLVTYIRIPFLSPVNRKEEPKTEWFKCRLSDELFNSSLNQTALTVTMDKEGNFFASIRCEQPKHNREKTHLECGVDVGIKTAVTVAYNAEGESSSEYDKYESYDLNKTTIIRLEKTIEHLQKQQNKRIETWLRLNGYGADSGKTERERQNMRKKYYRFFKSESFKRTEKRIAHLNIKIKNIRKDFQEKTSHILSSKYDSIGLETLNVKGMTKNHNLARSILRIGFYDFKVACERKFGKDNVHTLDTYAPSSKMCSKCGYLNKELKLKHRDWVCSVCGMHHDRDCNASSNIRPSMQAACVSAIATKYSMAERVESDVSQTTKSGGNKRSTHCCRPLGSNSTSGGKKRQSKNPKGKEALPYETVHRKQFSVLDEPV